MSIKKTIIETHVLKPLARMRIRCQEDHTIKTGKASYVDSWLRRLYMIYAAKPVAGDDGKPAKPSFYLVQTNDKGYVCPPVSQLDPDAALTLPMVIDHDYICYFVRHPDASLPKKILDDLAQWPDAQDKWGKPLPITPKLESTGKVQEGVIRVPESPDSFIPKGSDLYERWVLFRDMPGTGSNKVDSDIQCPPLLKHVRRLQFHLGYLRYPIGDAYHPYSPVPSKAAQAAYGEAAVPTTQKKLSAKRKRALAAQARARLGPVDNLAENEGVFGPATWNGVLAFQRDAGAGKAVSLNAALARTPVIDAGSFDPLPAAEDRLLEMRESANYVSSTDADIDNAPIDKSVLTVVDKNTGDAIRTWIQKGCRKPGRILVAFNDREWEWMREEVTDVIASLGQELNRLGYEQGCRFADIFRDARMSVVNPEPGQVVTSIHKSGFAFDFLEREFLTFNKYPLYWARDVANSGARTVWIVYALVDATKVPPADIRGEYVEYVGSITPWVYDKWSPTGGAPASSPLKAEGHVFLNFTKVCKHFQLVNISAHAKGWQLGEATFTLSSAKIFKAFVGRLKSIVAAATADPSAQVTVGGAQKFPISQFSDMSDYLSRWLKATGRLGPKPDITIKPGSKESEAVLRFLRDENSFKGRKVQLTIEGQLPPKTDRVQEIELTARTEFPSKSSFVLRPITTPLLLAPGQKLELPTIDKPGHPAHMEWWHFQYEPGYSGKTFGKILQDVGWTAEGLLGKGGNKWIFDHWGLGYDADDLSTNVH